MRKPMNVLASVLHTIRKDTGDWGAAGRRHSSRRLKVLVTPCPYCSGPQRTDGRLTFSTKWRGEAVRRPSVPVLVPRTGLRAGPVSWSKLPQPQVGSCVEPKPWYEGSLGVIYSNTFISSTFSCHTPFFTLTQRRSSLVAYETRCNKNLQINKYIKFI